MFAADPADEHAVRDRIASGVRVGSLAGPSGTSNWTVICEGRADLAAEEAAFAAQLASK